MNNNNAIIKICRVVSVTDDMNGDRIKVRLNPEDSGKSEKDLPFVHPLLPKLFHVKPKVGECVLVFLTELNNNYSTRYYIGPILSQPQFFEFDTYPNSLTLYSDSTFAPPEPITMHPESNGTFCKENEIGIYGRRKNDIILSENDVKIRCGSRLYNDTNGVNFNRNDSAYILLRHNTDFTKIEDESVTPKSSATIVADKINLVTNYNRDFKTNPDNLISDKDMEALYESAHQLPYGDILVKFLENFVKTFVNHTHSYPGLPPCETFEFNYVKDYNLKQILNEDIRIC